MDTRKGVAKFKNFRIILESGCSSKIITGRLIKKLSPKEDALMQCRTQAVSITTNLSVIIKFTLPQRGIVTWITMLRADMKQS